MNRFVIMLAFGLAGCDEPGAADGVVLKLEETDLPGVFKITSNAIDERIALTFSCADGVRGAATILGDRWLAARDRVEVEVRCGLAGKTLAGTSYESAHRSLTPGMLEAQRRLLDPPGDSGLDRWEEAALGDILSAALPPGIDRLAWRDRAGRLVVRSATGRGVYARQWSNDGMTLRRVELDGEDPCPIDAAEAAMDLEAWSGRTVALSGTGFGAEQGYRGDDDPRLRIQGATYPVPACATRLMRSFDNPNAPDLVAIPHPAAALPGSAAEHGDLSALSSQAGFLAWGAGVTTGTLTAPLRMIDIAPTAAAALGVGEVLGRAADGAAARTQLLRQDGVVRADMITPGSAEQFVLIVLDGLSATGLDRFIDGSEGFARMRDEGRWLRPGITAGFPSNTMPGHNTLGSGLAPGHHGIYDNEVFRRRPNDVLDLAGGEVFRGSRALFRAGAETLHQALAARPPPATPLAWSVAAGSPSFIGATTNALEGIGPGAEGWLQIGREPSFTDLPQAPDWAQGNTFALWETSVILAEYSLRMITGQQVAGERPTFLIANWPIIDAVAHQFGPLSDRSDEAMAAMDSMLARLLDSLARRGWQDKVTVVVCGDHGMSLSDPSAPRPDWWRDGRPWAENEVAARSILGAITIAALAYDKRIENGFVKLTVRDADSGSGGLAGVTLTLYAQDGAELSARVSGEDGVLNVPQPDRGVYGVLRAAGFSALRLNAAAFRL